MTACAIRYIRACASQAACSQAGGTATNARYVGYVNFAAWTAMHVAYAWTTLERVSCVLDVQNTFLRICNLALRPLSKTRQDHVRPVDYNRRTVCHDMTMKR